MSIAEKLYAAANAPATPAEPVATPAEPVATPAEPVATPSPASTPEKTPEAAPATKPAESGPVAEPAKADEKPAPESKDPAAADKKDEKAPEAKQPVVPEKYDLKLPEGSLLNADSVAKLTTEAKTLGLSQAQAQAVLNRESQLRASFMEDAKADLEKASNAWVEEVKSDKEIGGAEFARTAETSKRFIDRFASPAFKEMLNATGYGNHPEMVRMISRAAKLMSEDTMVIPGAQVSSAKKSAAEILYGSPTAAKE